jgi:hypothetical protein
MIYDAVQQLKLLCFLTKPGGFPFRSYCLVAGLGEAVNAYSISNMPSYQPMPARR